MLLCSNELFVALAGIRSLSLNVRYRGQPGKHLLVLSFTGFDLNRSLAGSKSRSAAVPRYAIPFVQAREVLGSETARVHHAARWRCRRVAAGGTRAATTQDRESWHSLSWDGSNLAFAPRRIARRITSGGISRAGYLSRRAGGRGRSKAHCPRSQWSWPSARSMSWSLSALPRSMPRWRRARLSQLSRL